MEKRVAHYSLDIVKTMIAAGKVRSTLSALAGAARRRLSEAHSR
jgi:hypothetical protein